METGGIPWAVGEVAVAEPIQRVSTTCPYCWSVGRRPEQMQGGKRRRSYPRYVPCQGLGDTCSSPQQELDQMRAVDGLILVMVCWCCGARWPEAIEGRKPKAAAATVQRGMDSSTVHDAMRK